MQISKITEVGPEKVVSAVTAIREYFGDISMDELKHLSKEERREIGELCAVELGKTLTPAKS